MNFPIIDLSDFVAGVPGATERTANQLREALEQVGFYAIVNHGVDWGKVERVFAEAKRFHAQSRAAKLKCPFSPAFTGYIPPAQHVLRTSQVHRNTKGDLNEAYFVEREFPPKFADTVRAANFTSANQWPEFLPGFKETVLDYYRTVEALAYSLLPLYARALELSPDVFAQAFGWPQASLRLSHYPAAPREDNQFGIAPHTDAGFLTILPQSDVAGLHIRPPSQSASSLSSHDAAPGDSARWIEAPQVPEGFFINSGDMLKRWTNDRFLSTQHMAVNESAHERYAAVFFFSPDLDYEMACLPSCHSEDNPPRYEPITYGQYRAWFMDSNYRPEEPPRAQAKPVSV